MSNRLDTVGLCDLLDRLLDTGVVIRGAITITVADIDMINIELALLIGAADKVMRVPAPVPNATLS